MHKLLLLLHNDCLVLVLCVTIFQVASCVERGATTELWFHAVQRSGWLLGPGIDPPLLSAAPLLLPLPGLGFRGWCRHREREVPSCRSDPIPDGHPGASCHPQSLSGQVSVSACEGRAKTSKRKHQGKPSPLHTSAPLALLLPSLSAHPQHLSKPELSPQSQQHELKPQHHHQLLQQCFNHQETWDSKWWQDQSTTGLSASWPGPASPRELDSGQGGRLCLGVSDLPVPSGWGPLDSPWCNGRWRDDTSVLCDSRNLPSRSLAPLPRHGERCPLGVRLPVPCVWEGEGPAAGAHLTTGHDHCGWGDGGVRACPGSNPPRTRQTHMWMNLDYLNLFSGCRAF